MSHIIGKKLYLPIQKVPFSVFENALSFAVKEMDKKVNQSKNKSQALKGKFEPIVLDLQNIEGYYEDASVGSFSELVKSGKLEKYLFDSAKEDSIFKACKKALAQSEYETVVEDFGVNVDFKVLSVESLIPEYDVDSANALFTVRVKSYIKIQIYC